MNYPKPSDQMQSHLCLTVCGLGFGWDRLESSASCDIVWFFSWLHWDNGWPRQKVQENFIPMSDIHSFFSLHFFISLYNLFYALHTACLLVAISVQYMAVIALFYYCPLLSIFYYA